jgi:hypothetical protein
MKTGSALCSVCFFFLGCVLAASCLAGSVLFWLCLLQGMLAPDQIKSVACVLVWARSVVAEV